MSQRACDTCAFGNSGGAADEVANRLKGLICAAGALPFFCHHGKDGAEYDWRNKDSKLGPLALAPQNRKTCAGWQAAVRVRKRAGYFKDHPGGLRYLRRFFAKRALGLLDRFTSKDLPREEKKSVQKLLERHCLFIFARDISDRELPLL